MFYKLAVLFTLIFLIICLIAIGILMQYQNAGKKFPYRSTVCPDLWTISTDGKSCSTSGNNKGTFNGSPSIVLENYPTICEKKIWTKTNGIRWDGVSNYTGCA